MNGLAKGTRISYRSGRTISHGTIVASGTNSLGGRYLVVRTDLGARIVNILPQQVVRFY